MESLGLTSRALRRVGAASFRARPPFAGERRRASRSLRTTQGHTNGTVDDCAGPSSSGRKWRILQCRLERAGRGPRLQRVGDCLHQPGGMGTSCTRLLLPCRNAAGAKCRCMAPTTATRWPSFWTCATRCLTSPDIAARCLETEAIRARCSSKSRFLESFQACVAPLLDKLARFFMMREWLGLEPDAIFGNGA
uniref:RNA polymerase sigma factor n=1 Tax=Burkholderia sp. B8(2020) TaxID=2713619 RepID=A0A6G6CWT5_9BURK|nr:RNA polymerase sigma factor [Burkholderia sp. B8(2020)]